MTAMQAMTTEKWDLEKYRIYLREKEYASATVGKYLTDVRTFLSFLGEEREITRETLLRYKEWLIARYAVSSVNSMLAALNRFLIYLGYERWKIKRLKVQRRIFDGCQKELMKEEYFRLLKAARAKGDEQLALIMETICATGIRVSELKYFRAEFLKENVLRVRNKGKYRMIILPDRLRKRLVKFAKSKGVTSGCIFLTAGGKEKNRSGIWREMKRLAGEAGIEECKVFPHNLRHLFARTFYRMTGNLVQLADILGHSSIEVTRIYAAEGISEWKKTMERMQLLQVT